MAEHRGGHRHARAALEGGTTKKEAVRLGLEALLRRERQNAVRRLRGTLVWEGDLDAVRTNA